MLYDTRYRHDQALAPSGIETLPAALHALNAAVDDCQRAGKPIARDPAIILLIRNLADVAERSTPATGSLSMQCTADRTEVIGAPALLDIAGHDVGGDPSAKRIFHHQARHAPSPSRTRPARHGNRPRSGRRAHQHRPRHG